MVSIVRFGYLPLLIPKKPLFSGQAYNREVLLDAFASRRTPPFCAYCGNNFDKKQSVTFDHARPDMRGGRDEPANGILACQPCNHRRSNFSLLYFLQGTLSHDDYLRPDAIEGNTPLSGIQQNAKKVKRRIYSFSRYLRFFVENQIRINPITGSTWFNQAIDNLLFPILLPREEKQEKYIAFDRYKTRFKALVRLLTPTSPEFWLGRKFQGIISADFNQQPLKKNAFIKALQELRMEYQFNQ